MRGARSSERHPGFAEAVEADLVAHVSLLYEPIAEVHREPVAVWFASGGGSPHENGVLRAELPRRSIGRAVERLLAPFRERRLPMCWWVFAPPERRPALLDRVLRRHGLVLASDLPGMALDLERFSPPPPAGGVSTHRVVDREGLQIWGEIVGRAFGTPDFVQGRSFRGFSARGFGDEAAFRHYVCRLGEEWVGAATLSLGGGVAGLANMATLPQARRRGVGTASAVAALQDAKTLGLRIAALSAEDVGRPLYERLGFREVSRHRTYLWHPP